MPDSLTAQSFLAKRDRSLAEHLVACVLLPFTLLYWVVMSLRRILYRIGVLKSIRLPLKVISVGGITIGGSGKTPMVMYIAEHLESAGRNTIILTRGYGGRPKHVAVVKPRDGASEANLSDEVRLMRRKVSSVIGVGADRVASFRKACESMKFDAAILDDGFQHLRIERDMDIVTVNASAPFGNSWLLPSGNLREPKKSLGRADMIVVTRTSRSNDVTEVMTRLQDRFRNATVMLADYVPDGFENVRSGQIGDGEGIFAEPVFAFSAIANPDLFFSMLEEEGFTVRARKAFRDHHVFTQRDIDELSREAKSAGCRVFVVTEKDAVKLKSLDSSDIPVHAFRIRLHITGGEHSFSETIARVFDD